MNHPLVQLVFMALAVWGGFSFLMKSQFGWFVALLLTIAAAGSALVTYLLRYDRPKAERLYAIPGLRHFIYGVCRLGSLPPPEGGSEVPANLGSSSGSSSPENGRRSEKKDGKAPKELALTCEEDFHAARAKLKMVVKGLDSTIDGIMDQIEGRVILRSRQKTTGALPPLGAFLVAGAPGIGKRHLAVAIGQVLYSSHAMTSVDLRDYDRDPMAVLFGSGAGHVGTILAAVKARPYQTIIIENVERLDGRGMDGLSRILSSGTCRDESTGMQVSFQSTVFVLTTTCGVSQLLTAKSRRDGSLAEADAESRSAIREKWLHDATDILSRHGAFNLRLLSSLNELVVVGPPTAMERAAVTLLLLHKECSKYNIDLKWVHPQVIAEEVAAISEDEGYSTLPARVTALLNEPLVQATKNKSTQLVIDPEAE